jgi:hypothetical protein
MQNDHHPQPGMMLLRRNEHDTAGAHQTGRVNSTGDLVVLHVDATNGRTGAKCPGAAAHAG